MTNYIKSCSFLYAHFFELMKVVENLSKKLMVKNSLIEKIYDVGSSRQFQCVPTTYVAENKDNYLDIVFPTA